MNCHIVKKANLINCSIHLHLCCGNGITIVMTITGKVQLFAKIQMTLVVPVTFYHSNVSAIVVHTAKQNIIYRVSRRLCLLLVQFQLDTQYSSQM